ncbi:hypothetical protein NOVOSPHI9U_210019 [Novosphingobium sp. 9U]|nr:hypothetical protein NOVOSPHI9U_210019 [Novosphingobium sp. 9U]
MSCMRLSGPAGDYFHADDDIAAPIRTQAAGVRTGLAALAAGVRARALLELLVPDRLALATASLLVHFPGFCFVAAVWRGMMRLMPISPDTRQLPPLLLIAVNARRIVGSGVER